MDFNSNNILMNYHQLLNHVNEGAIFIIIRRQNSGTSLKYLHSKSRCTLIITIFSVSFTRFFSSVFVSHTRHRAHQTNVKMFNRKLLPSGLIITYAKPAVIRSLTYSKIYAMDINFWRFSKLSLLKNM